MIKYINLFLFIVIIFLLIIIVEKGNEIKPNLIVDNKKSSISNEFISSSDIQSSSDQESSIICEYVSIEDEKIKEKIKSLLGYVYNYDDYNLSILYFSLTRGHAIIDNDSKVYFSASLIKLLPVIYLMNESNEGKIDLNEKVKSSTGNMTSIYDLIKLVLSKSDNPSHKILVDYIGTKTLNEYGKTLGTHYEMKKYFGSIDVYDAKLYLDEIYKLIIKENDNSMFLKTYMDNNYDNSLNFGSIKFLHKHGRVDDYYHDIGIHLSDEPYYLIILSDKVNNEYKKVFENISRRIYEINTMLNKKVCK